MPPEVNAAKNVTAIATGALPGLALTREGTVVAWGENPTGQTDVPAGLTDVVAIAVGWTNSLAIKRDGTVVAWGDNRFGQTNVPAGLSGVTAIAAGEDHSLALLGSATPPTINHGPSIQVIKTPTSVVEDTLESNKYIRAFTEHQNYTLPQAITINGTTIPAGTKVNVFYLHADKMGTDNTKSLKLSGWVSFNTQVLGVISDSATLLNTNSTLGSPITAYSARTDQGLDLTIVRP